MQTSEPKTRAQEIDAVRERYAGRIKKRLAEPKIDVAAARDGMLDCFVATYFGGLEQGIQGYLGIDAKEEQVAQVARSLFKKKLRAQGVTFEAPTVDALDRVKQEVDDELHFEELPAELRGLHDQVCSLMLSKADGALEHHGDRSAVRGSSPTKPAASVAAPSPAPAAAAPAAPAAPTGSPSGAHVGLRESLKVYLRETAEMAATASTDVLRERMARTDRLVALVADFEG